MLHIKRDMVQRDVRKACDMENTRHGESSEDLIPAFREKRVTASELDGHDPRRTERRWALGMMSDVRGRQEPLIPASYLSYTSCHTPKTTRPTFLTSLTSLLPSNLLFNLLYTAPFSAQLTSILKKPSLSSIIPHHPHKTLPRCFLPPAG